MGWQPIKLATQSYLSRSPNAAVHRLVNMYAEANPEGGNGPVSLMPTPGLLAWSEVGDGPIRGLRKMSDALYVVSGQELYVVDTSKNAVLLGEIVGAQGCRMADDGTHVLICTESTPYAANASGISILAEGNFNGVDVQDGYGILTRRGSNAFCRNPRHWLGNYQRSA